MWEREYLFFYRLNFLRVDECFLVCPSRDPPLVNPGLIGFSLLLAVCISSLSLDVVDLVCLGGVGFNFTLAKFAGVIGIRATVDFTVTEVNFGFAISFCEKPCFGVILPVLRIDSSTFNKRFTISSGLFP